MRRLPSSDEEEGEDGSPRARLQGLAAPAPEYWSDEEPGSSIWQAESASEPRRDRAAPAERKFGGPRLDEPLSWPLVGRLLFYTAALSLCLTSCEVLTMWVSLHVRWAISPRFLLGLVWFAARCACGLALPYWRVARGCQTQRADYWCSLVSAFGLLKYPAVWKARR